MCRDDVQHKINICAGRPEDKLRLEAFSHVTQYLEYVDTAQVTVRDLVEEMNTFLRDSECQAYSHKYTKSKLMEHYGDEIVFAESNKKADVISLKRTANTILRDFYKEARNSDTEAEAKRLIKAAASLIRSDIASLAGSKDVYPDTESIRDHQNYAPLSLTSFLQHVTKKHCNLKISAIGQAIIQLSRPNTVIAPLQFALGVQMHRSFGSRFLVDTLSHLGFSCSYTEVRKFELNAAQSYGIDLPPTTESNSVQFIADNVDHNSVTLDGRHTFHGMGIMATITPGVNTSRQIPRREVSMKDIKAIGQISINFYRSDWAGLNALVFHETPTIQSDDDTVNLDLLWTISWPLKSPCPLWNGMMQMLHDGEHPGKSSFIFLPMIDLSSTDMSCIYSTLKFVCCQALKNKVAPILTFDQPLYIKALSITSGENADSELQNLILRLGTFHLQMSFLGTIGYLMAGSGLQEMLEVPFAPNAVVHMLTGKAYARAVRAHLLTDAALHALLMADAFQVPQILFCPEEKESNKEEEEESVGASLAAVLELSPERSERDRHLVEDLGHDDLNTAKKLLQDLFAGSVSTDEAIRHEIIPLIHSKLNQQKEMISSNRTAALWIQYMHMIDILRKSIKAERTGNFKLHLESVQEMFPFLAASGHNNYTKSGWLYLQQMLDLQDAHPEVYAFFSRGHHVVRRTNSFWAGISTDLAIEQVLMRSVKSNGGLTRGTGVGEAERLVWLLCMPACAEIHDAMQSVTDVGFHSSEQQTQHKELSMARQKRDHKDIQMILKYLLGRNPFTVDSALRSISSGKEAEASVNAEQAKGVGDKILSSMIGKNIVDVTFKKKDQAVTMALKAKSSNLHDDLVHVDSMLLFQRLVTTVKNTNGCLEDAFAFEMCSVPASLFDSGGLPRQGTKAALATYIWTSTKQVNGVIPDDVAYVIDGGFLLHLLPWCRGSTYNQLTQSYADFLIRHFGKGTVVFDGYSCGPTTKDAAHMRRTSRANAACAIIFEGDMVLCEPKERFLANPNNKQRFINLLSSCFSQHGFDTVHATADADRLVVKTSLDLARKGNVVLVDEDTDLLILLLHHLTPDHCPVFFTSVRSSTAKTAAKVWDIRNVQTILGSQVCENILFVHAFGGCDTISSPFGIGKPMCLKKLTQSLVFVQQAHVFSASPCRDTDELIGAGERAFVELYGGKDRDTLNFLRYIKYMQKVSTCTSSFQPCKLPPTSAAAKFHSMRSYFQVQEWMHLDQEQFLLDPMEWGWEIVQGVMVPILTDIAAAPGDLLDVIRCNCKTECQTARCSCRKHGLVCTSGCGECRGESCANTVTKVACVPSDDEDGL